VKGEIDTGSRYRAQGKTEYVKGLVLDNPALHDFGIKSLFSYEVIDLG
jgi:hypothetical protein